MMHARVAQVPFYWRRASISSSTQAFPSSTTSRLCESSRLTPQATPGLTYYRWRKKYGGLMPSEVMASQDRQVNFSRTVCTTFHCRGIDCRLSVIVSPSLLSLPPQHGHVVGAGMTTRCRGRCSSNGARTGLRLLKACTTVLSPVAAEGIANLTGVGRGKNERCMVN